ncbi:MAG TPA: response regulator [Candidatus Hydrogenedentes bacterium]|nr:response regulator [Candidatus Hydrogenedentota bacterium]HPG67201.1 response regulator [Candidatus Hydrogenedentota bacterium]
MALNILVVDDSSTVRAVIAKTLRLADVPINQLYEAANGEEALRVVATQWVDLIFSDINMPVMGGVEMVERMKDDALLSSIPIVIVSTEGSATRIDELMSKGVRAYIRKPFTPESVRSVVDDIIGLSHGSE